MPGVELVSTDGTVTCDSAPLTTDDTDDGSDAGPELVSGATELVTEPACCDTVLIAVEMALCAFEIAF
jgi:hypothetical protein